MIDMNASYYRPRAYEDVYRWCYELHKPGDPANPIQNTAIFVVHGMGNQEWAETAAELRSGFETAIEEIASREDPSTVCRNTFLKEHQTPFIQEGYWADYTSMKAMFPGIWKLFDKGEKIYFATTVSKELSNLGAIKKWYKEQLGRLPSLKLKNELTGGSSVLACLLYRAIMFPGKILIGFFHHCWKDTFTNVLGDVKNYIEPVGPMQRAFIQRIDYKIGEQFLRLIGLDWDFRPLPSWKCHSCDSKCLIFDRVVWVAHSLGSVISYNTLADITAKAVGILQSADSTKEQKAGANRFFSCLVAFVTLGSPLDKVAFLFGSKTIKEWDRTHMPRDFKWVNYFHVFDPVSGPLRHRVIVGPDTAQPIINTTMSRFWRIPFCAHTQYWNDTGTLQDILSFVFDTINPARLNMSCNLHWKVFQTIFIWTAITLLIAGIPVGILVSILWLIDLSPIQMIEWIASIP